MYPLGVNSITRRLSTAFPVIFELESTIYYKGLSDLLLSEGKIKIGLNASTWGTKFEWADEKDEIRTTFTKIENDIPYKKLPSEKTARLTDNYSWGEYNVKEMKALHLDATEQTFFPSISLPLIPDKIGKYWVRCYYAGVQTDNYNQPDYELIQTNGGKEITFIFSPNVESARTIFDTPTNHFRRVEIYNKPPPLELPITIQFTKYSRDYWAWNIDPLGSFFDFRGDNTRTVYYKARFFYDEVKHTYASGTQPFFFNLGDYKTLHDYITGNFTPPSIHPIDNQTTEDINVVNAHNNPLSEQGLIVDVMTLADWSQKHKTEVHKLLKDRFIYEFSYPREYGLKGIKFYDAVHDYKIDSFTKPTGNGAVTYDRFRIKLAFPMDSRIEITKEPTSWVFHRRRFRLRTKAGWVNSGGDEWGNHPVAQGADIIGDLPSNMKLIGGWKNLSRNTGNDKWIGYYFLFENPFNNKVGFRMTQKPTETLLRENVADPNFQVQVFYNEHQKDQKYPLLGILIKDYNPASVARASTHRNAKNRWSIYIHPIEFEMEMYLK